MAIPSLELQAAEVLLKKYCTTKVPPEFHNKLRIEYGIRGRLVTIFERRPVWNDADAEWTKVKVAQFEWLADERKWCLKCSDRNGKWHRYDDVLMPQRKLADLLAEVERDPTGIFWG